MEKLIIGLIGGPGSGKTTVANYLAEKKGFAVVRFSDLIREEASLRKVQDPDRKYLQDLGDEIRRTEGADGLGRRVLAKISGMNSDHIAADGFRDKGDMEPFLSRNFTSIALIAEQKTRFERLVKRGSTEDTKDWHEFQKIDAREHTSCIDLAEYKIDADAPLESVFAKIDLILEKKGII